MDQPKKVNVEKKVEEKVEIDTGEFFVTDLTWKQREDCLNWVRGQARKVGFTIVIQRSNAQKSHNIQIGCERGGKYEEKSNKKLKRETTGSRKRGCPFRLRAYYYEPSKLWSLITTNGLHNHKMECQGHLLAGRLTASTKSVVKELTSALVQPKNILSNLKGKDKDCATTLKQVYNCRARLGERARGEMTEIQHSMTKLEENHYVNYSRTKCETTTTLQDIFFSHPKCIKFLSTFPTVLVLDSTYRTNMYKMPLLEIVGVTSTDKTYSVGFAFLANEKRRQLHLGPTNGALSSHRNA